MQHLIVTKQLSIYIIFASLVISATLMPSFTTLVIATPVNAALLFFLRWAAHREAEIF